MSPEAKAALLKRLADGRTKTKAMRAEAKEKNLPDPKPRKARKSKKHAEVTDPKEAIPDPLSAATKRETLAPISGAPAMAKNKVASMPVDPEKTVTTEIDVPNLPSEKKMKDIVKDAEEVPEAGPRKGISTTGKPEKYNDNELIRSKESGNQAIEVQYPGQKESILKVLKANKKENKPLAPKSEPSPPTTTVTDIPRHVPDIKAVEARQPFSFAAIRKVLYQ
jgi:hypothetical protein